MDKILNPVLAPFSSDRASKTSPAGIAVAYGLIGLLVGVLVLKD
ncbi:membrane protein P10 [Pseudomonas phage phi12]|uniref:Membrane protein P10 n=1 Tax=Pseudomonas phage phi12 TaxID=161736 RepID=Q94ML4_9VIRU|nr:membrane protein P10 [Pseudomonas phage phi12]AAK74122.1 membrane protein P10 [Pseudomonas phage phi12]